MNQPNIPKLPTKSRSRVSDFIADEVLNHHERVEQVVAVEPVAPHYSVSSKHFPSLSAKTSPLAAELCHKYRISQWRTTRYLTAISDINDGGASASTLAIIRQLSPEVRPQAVNRAIPTLLEGGLVECVGREGAARLYSLTSMGKKAVVHIRQIETVWEQQLAGTIHHARPRNLIGSTFKPAMDFIRDYKINQWRVTASLIILSDLAAEGNITPTTSVAGRRFSPRRPTEVVVRSLGLLVEAGLVEVYGSHSAPPRQRMYTLTAEGKEAAVRARDVIAEWEALADSRPTAGNAAEQSPDIQISGDGPQKRNLTGEEAQDRADVSPEQSPEDISAMAATISSQQKTIAEQDELIADLRRQIAAAA